MIRPFNSSIIERKEDHLVARDDVDGVVSVEAARDDAVGTISGFASRLVERDARVDREKEQTMSIDLVLGWSLAIAGIAGVIALVVVAIRQILEVHRNDPVVRPVWIAVVVLYPIGGATAWLVWDSWLRVRVHTDQRQGALR